MSTTTITGTIHGVNNSALANKWISFRLVQLGTDSTATITVAQSVDSVQTDSNGDFSIDIWDNGTSGKKSVLEITVEGSRAEFVIIPEGTASIELWDLIENYQADGSTSGQVPVESALFVRKSNNLSDLGSASTSRTNLGVSIGTDVQAHSATLDATTASFTTADESKLDGIEALADVTDATNIAASGGYIAGGTDVALADGGTGASDTSTARTNLGLVIGSDVQEHSLILDATTASFTAADKSKLDGIEALADVTDATNIAASGGYVAGGTDVALTDGGTGASDAPTARTNLNVPSNAEAVLVANNLSEVNPVIARANLGVPSSQEGLSAANNLSELTPTSSTARTNIDVPSNSEAVLVANNLSEVNAPTARTNLGVVIGTNVQAHSTVLDATTESFLIADKTKLNGIEALADVTDATKILNSGGYISGTTVVPIADGGTGASTLAGARTNLGIVTFDGLLRTENLFDIPDTAAARINLGLTSMATAQQGDFATAQQGSLAENSLQTTDLGSTVQGYDLVLDQTTASYTTEEKLKLSLIEDEADVTDAIKVEAAGAYMVDGTDVLIADGGTGASDIINAKANLGFLRNTDGPVVQVFTTPTQIFNYNRSILVDDDSMVSVPVLTLPTAVSVGSGWTVSIKKNGATWPVQIVAPGIEKIDGVGFMYLYIKDESITLRSDGSNWHIYSAYKPGTTESIKTLTNIYYVTALDTVVLVDDDFNPTSNQYEVFLPSINSVGNGFIVEIKKLGSSQPVQIFPLGADSFQEGGNSLYLKITNQSIRFISNNGKWSILSQYIPRVTGWANYSNNPASIQSIPASANTELTLTPFTQNDNQLPIGVSSFWDSLNNRLLAIETTPPAIYKKFEGDSYDITVNLSIQGTNQDSIVEFDLKTDVANPVTIFRRSITVKSGTENQINIGFSAPIIGDLMNFGAKMYIDNTLNNDILSVSNLSLFIKRDYVAATEIYSSN
jgi:hypothetical protein